jgi:hypothetical protein
MVLPFGLDAAGPEFSLNGKSFANAGFAALALQRDVRLPRHDAIPCARHGNAKLGIAFYDISTNFA